MSDLRYQFRRPLLQPVAAWTLVFTLLLALASGGSQKALAQDDTLAIDAYFDQPHSRSYEERMVERIRAQIGRYFDRYNERVYRERSSYWTRDFSSAEAYVASVDSNRQRLQTITGVVDKRVPVTMDWYGRDGSSSLILETPHYTVRRVRWSVLDGVYGEGLLLTPSGSIDARVVAIPDAGQTPEQIAGVAEGVPASEQFARRLAESGVQVVVPALLNRDNTVSGSDSLVPHHFWMNENDEYYSRFTNQTHREWIHRQAYVMGRHVIGYEVQKVLAAVDWFHDQSTGSPAVGVVGYAEGGLLAFYSAAMDRRIDAALVSGYYEPREDVWKEPVYRNIWSLLKRFGDAEIASLIGPRKLIVEYSDPPHVEEPLPPVPGDHRGSNTGSPGRITTPSFDAVQREVQRARDFFPDDGSVQPDITFIHGADGSTVHPGSEESLRALGKVLGFQQAPSNPSAVKDTRVDVDTRDRQERMVTELSRHLRRMMHHHSDFSRFRFMNGDKSSPRAWDRSMEKYRSIFYEELIGKLPDYDIPLDVERRKIFDREHWVGYEVVIEILPGVKGWGLLGVPKDIDEGEERPTVVVQHGHAGTITTPVRVDSYNNILPRLCERGFVVFAPFNPYQFNVRKANPLKAGIFSVIVPQHQKMVDYLQTLDYVDDDRIGFYGKSWGGRTALRVPPLVPEYSPVISAAYFNWWPRKVLDPNFYQAVLYTGSIGVYEFNQGNTFGHAEMAKMIAPRPFMVESGYYDGVQPDAWVGYEFAKVQRLYNFLGIGDRAVLGFHVGGHEVHADTIFPFLHRHLQWPAPATE